MCDGRESFPDLTVWSDERTSELRGIINQHSCVYWATEYSNIMEQQVVNLPGTSVWYSMSSTLLSTMNWY
jgi:hypothetical protein